MSEDLEQWHWVDEDPFEKLIHAPKKGENDLGAKALAECGEPTRFEGAPSSKSEIALYEPDQPAAHVDPAIYPENVEQALECPAETDGVPEPVVERYSVAVAVEPGNPAARRLDLAEHQERLPTWEQAADSFRQVLQLEPGSAEALIGLGACLLHLDCAEEALHCFEQCCSDTERLQALLGKAVALHKLGYYEDADRAYRDLHQITPDSPEPLANLIALSVTRRDSVAIAEFSRRLLRVDPRNKAALQGLATVAIWNGDKNAAVDYCSRLVEVDPTSFEGWYNLGFANQMMFPARLRSIA